MTRCILYARVSTDKQAERQASIPAQLKAMKDYAQKKGWSILKAFEEEGESARSADRPVLQEALQYAQTEPSVDVFLVHKLDRLARSILDTVTIRMNLKASEVRIDSVTEHIGDKAHEVMQQNIVAVVNEWYSSNLSEEAKKGQRQAIQEGRWPHKSPYGYTASKNEQGKAIKVPDPKTGPAVKLMFDLYATDNFSFKGVARELARRGYLDRTGKPFRQDIIRRRLRNPFYAGKLPWGGEIHDGIHEPLVPLSIFGHVQEIIENRSRRPGFAEYRHTFLLRGLLVCLVCKRYMSAERHAKGSYYRCQPYNRPVSELCSQPYAREDVIDAEVLAIYRKIRFKNKEADAVAAAAKDAIAGRQRQYAEELTRVRSELSRVQERLVGASSLLAEGTLSPRAYEPLRERTEATLLRLEGRIQELEEATAVDEGILPLAIRLASRLDLVHEVLDKKQSKQLAACIFKSITVYDRHVLDFEFRAPFSGLIAPDLVLRFSEEPSEGANGVSWECPQETPGRSKSRLLSVTGIPDVERVLSDA